MVVVDKDSLACTVEVRDGFANQVLAYAAGFAQARRLGGELGVDRSALLHPDSPRFGLDDFESSYVDATAANQFRRTSAQRLLDQKLVPRRARTRLLRKLKVYRPENTTFCSSVRDVKFGTYMTGVYYSWRYFESVADDIRQQLRGYRTSGEWLRRWSAQLALKDKPIALHVRRGDYLQPQYGGIGVCGPAYYSGAVRLLRDLGHLGVLFVFSDDPQSARELIPSGEEAIFVDTSGPEIETIILMSMCDSIVVANSSFSWLGAWLSENSRNGLVIAPHPWTLRALNSQDIVLPSWITLSSDLQGRGANA